MNPAALYRWRAPFYDLELLPFEPLRRAAVAALDLRPSQTVLDLGCGTGLSLDLLQRGVGPGSRVIAVEPCPEMLARARRRVQAAGWRNVTLIEAPAARASWDGPPADAALFAFTHDILQDEAALRRVLAALRPGARLAATGLAWAPAWALPANLFVCGAALYSISALQGLDAPWARLQALSGPLTLRRPPGFFIACGQLRST